MSEYLLDRDLFAQLEKLGDALDGTYYWSLHPTCRLGDFTVNQIFDRQDSRTGLTTHWKWRLKEWGGSDPVTLVEVTQVTETTHRWVTVKD